MKQFTSKRISNLVQSDIRAMTAECLKVSGINLGQGLCELPTPKEIIEASVDAIRDDSRGTYSPAAGTTELREAISKKLLVENGIKADPEKNVVVTIGATGGYTDVMMSLLNPGEGVLVFEPFYGYHVNAALLAGLVPQYIPMEGADLGISEENIRRAIKKNSRAIVICTPANPCGKMFDEDELAIISKIANEFDLLVITDEMYEYFRFDGKEHISPASQPGLEDRTITMMGLSKTFSITGWRLGYLSAPEAMADKIKLANDLFYVCAPTPLQHGVTAGFSISEKYFIDLRNDFQKRRDEFCAVLDGIGLKPWIPEGAYYVLADISEWGFNNSKEAAMTLLEKSGVASVPGQSFFNSDQGNKYLRFCFAVHENKLKEAMVRLKSFEA